MKQSTASVLKLSDPSVRNSSLTSPENLFPIPWNLLTKQQIFLFHNWNGIVCLQEIFWGFVCFLGCGNGKSRIFQKKLAEEKTASWYVFVCSFPLFLLTSISSVTCLNTACCVCICCFLVRESLIVAARQDICFSFI